MTKAKQNEARAELARMRETKNQTPEGVAIFAAFASVSLPMALDALETAEAELARMRDRMEVLRMGWRAETWGSRTPDEWTVRPIDDEYGPCDRALDELTEWDETAGHYPTWPTEEAALDAAVAALREVGLMKELRAAKEPRYYGNDGMPTEDAGRCAVKPIFIPGASMAELARLQRERDAALAQLAEVTAERDHLHADAAPVAESERMYHDAAETWRERALDAERERDRLRGLLRSLAWPDGNELLNDRVLQEARAELAGSPAPIPWRTLLAAVVADPDEWRPLAEARKALEGAPAAPTPTPSLEEARKILEEALRADDPEESGHSGGLRFGDIIARALAALREP